MKNTRKALLALLVSGLLVMSHSAVAGGYYHHGGHHRGHHGHGGALAAGLLIGGLFGYMINEDRHRYSSSYSYRDYRPGYYPRTTVVYERVERVPTVVTTEVDSEFAGHDCMMTREYTTTIKIDGVDKEAYGTRCMTADGGWILGQPKFMPEL